MIELAKPTEVVALKIQWEKEQGQRYTTPQQYVEHISKVKQLHYKRRGPGEYTDERKSTLQLIAENYKASEEKRKAKRPWAKAKVDKDREENERWDRIYKEKFEDKHYYGGVRIP